MNDVMVISLDLYLDLVIASFCRLLKILGPDWLHLPIYLLFANHLVNRCFQFEIFHHTA